MKKSRKRALGGVGGAAAGLALAAAGAAHASAPEPSHLIDPALTETTIIDESFAPDGSPISTTTTLYDAEGRVVSTTTTTP